MGLFMDQRALGLWANPGVLVIRGWKICPGAAAPGKSTGKTSLWLHFGLRFTRWLFLTTHYFLYHIFINPASRWQCMGIKMMESCSQVKDLSLLVSWLGLQKYVDEQSLCPQAWIFSNLLLSRLTFNNSRVFSFHPIVAQVLLSG